MTLPLTGDALAIAEQAIDMAIQETKMYLTRYDLLQIFGDATTDTAATFTADSFLLDIIKTISVWQLMALANANIMYDSWKDRYEQKIASLKQIQKGIADPRWPYLDPTDQTAPPSDLVTIKSNPLRSNYY
jgi:hypothetical protein